MEIYRLKRDPAIRLKRIRKFGKTSRYMHIDENGEPVKIRLSKNSKREIIKYSILLGFDKLVKEK